MKTLLFRSVATLALASSLATLAGCFQAGQYAAVQGGENWQALSFNGSDRQELLIYYKDRDTLTKLASAGADIYSVDVPNKTAQVALDARQAALARRLGMGVSPMPLRLNWTVDKGYRSYTELLAGMQQLAAQHPDFVQLQYVGDSWEKKQGKADRGIWAIHLSSGPAANKPVVIFAGCTHAREIVTPEVVMQEAEALVANYNKDPDTTAAINTRDIWLIPMVNPDGHNLVLTRGASQRKNTNNVTGGRQHIGVDLNRNYDAVWGTVGDSDDPNSDVFRGTAPFSEPETQAMRDFLTAHHPEIYLSFHSYSNSVMWPYDSTTQAPSDQRLLALGKQLGQVSGYKPYQGCDMYLNSGDDVEWAYRTMGTLAYTVEIGGDADGFMPPFAKMPQFFKENSAIMNYCLKVADHPGVPAAAPQVALRI